MTVLFVKVGPRWRVFREVSEEEIGRSYQSLEKPRRRNELRLTQDGTSADLPSSGTRSSSVKSKVLLFTLTEKGWVPCRAGFHTSAAGAD